MVTPKLVVTSAAITAGSSLVLPMPGGGAPAIVAGDVVTVAVRSQSSTTEAVPPASMGWVKISAAWDGGLAGARVSGLWAKTATASEAATNTFTVPFRAVGAVAVWSVNDVVLERTGYSPDMRGTWDPAAGGGGGRRTAEYAITHPSLVLFLASSEFTTGNTHVPAAWPADYEQLANVQTGTGTASSRTALAWAYRTVGGSAVPSAALGWVAGVAGEAAQSASLRLVGEVQTGLPVELGSGATGYMYVANGAGGQLPVEDVLALPRQGYTIAQMEAEFPTKQVYWAHRGGSRNWAEETMRAYTNSIWHGIRAIEVSVWSTIDGVFAMTHDDSLLRTTGVDVNTSDSLWANIAGTPITVPVPGGGLARLEEVLSTYAQDFVLILEEKQNTHLAELLDLVETFLPDAQQRVVIKMFIDAADGPTPAYVRSRGYKIWAYLYDDDAVNKLPTAAAKFDYLGLNWDATQANWDAAKSYGKPVLAHVLATQAHMTAAVARGADGYQVGNVLVLAPKVNDVP